jgi:hypothetical protein
VTFLTTLVPRFAAVDVIRRAATGRNRAGPGSVRQAMSTHHRRRLASLALTPALALAVVACSSAGTATNAPSTAPSEAPSTAPSAAPSGSPATGAIDHKTGSTDIVLRYDEGGGFVNPAFLASQVPHFTLYGDGTVIFRNPMLELPAAQGSVGTFNPLRTTKLTEEQIQELLTMALGEGGLAIARPNYENNMVADASTAVFTVNAGGIEKTVSVYALGMDVQGGADAPARAAFQKLAQRLTDFDQGGTFETAVYKPEGYRAVLMDAAGVQAPDIRKWPWADLKVADFQPDADPNGPQFPHRTMTPAEIEKLEVKDFEGGFQGLVLTGSDDKLYTLSLRPLLPGEKG